MIDPSLKLRPYDRLVRLDGHVQAFRPNMFTASGGMRRHLLTQTLSSVSGHVERRSRVVGQNARQVLVPIE